MQSLFCCKGATAFLAQADTRHWMLHIISQVEGQQGAFRTAAAAATQCQERTCLGQPPASISFRMTWHVQTCHWVHWKYFSTQLCFMLNQASLWTICENGESCCTG